MNKSEIYVEITNEQERLRAIEILEKAGERIWDYPKSMEINIDCSYLVCCEDGDWLISPRKRTHQITLDQLEEMLMPKSIIGTQSNNPILIAQRYIIDNFPEGTVVTITNGLIEVK
jgi:hypothetical protein